MKSQEIEMGLGGNGSDCPKPIVAGNPSHEVSEEDTSPCLVDGSEVQLVFTTETTVSPEHNFNALEGIFVSNEGRRNLPDGIFSFDPSPVVSKPTNISWECSKTVHSSSPHQSIESESIIPKKNSEHTKDVNAADKSQKEDDCQILGSINSLSPNTIDLCDDEESCVTPHAQPNYTINVTRGPIIPTINKIPADAVNDFSQIQFFAWNDMQINSILLRVKPKGTQSNGNVEVISLSRQAGSSHRPDAQQPPARTSYSCANNTTPLVSFARNSTAKDDIVTCSSSRNVSSSQGSEPQAKDTRTAGNSTPISGSYYENQPSSSSEASSSDSDSDYDTRNRRKGVVLKKIFRKRKVEKRRIKETRTPPKQKPKSQLLCVVCGKIYTYPKSLYKHEFTHNRKKMSLALGQTNSKFESIHTDGAGEKHAKNDKISSTVLNLPDGSSSASLG